jgi:hypothetical protein
MRRAAEEHDVDPEMCDAIADAVVFALVPYLKEEYR